MRLPVHTLALSAAIAALFATQLALASEALDVKASGSMSGEKSYSTIHVASGVTLKVSALAGESGGLLRLRANSIVVDSGATIDATGAGYAGIDQGAGLGPGGGQPGAAGLPGGGGAFGGHGGEGSSAACAVITDKLGGKAYADPMMIDFGSAGGAAGVMNEGTAGGRGGGAIVLEAAEIELNGAIIADGSSGTSIIGMIGSGGGSGGLVVLRTNKLTLGPNAKISARGGDGGTGAKSGGGGGGGLVVVDALAMGLVPDVSAGKSGDCTMITGHVGDAPPSAGPSGCLDVDGDMHTASLCGGDDCDDADANVRPGATEVCDGVDNDCSGAADDMLPNDACSAGLECREGACVVPLDAGSAGNGAGEKPMELTFGGGCSTSKGSSTRGDAVLLAGILALTKLRRRARRQRP